MVANAQFAASTQPTVFRQSWDGSYLDPNGIKYYVSTVPMRDGSVQPTFIPYGSEYQCQYWLVSFMPIRANEAATSLPSPNTLHRMVQRVIITPPSKTLPLRYFRNDRGQYVDENRTRQNYVSAWLSPSVVFCYFTPTVPDTLAPRGAFSDGAYINYKKVKSILGSNISNTESLKKEVFEIQQLQKD